MGEVGPRFRQDLVAVAADADGVACVDVEDPRSGKRFRFYDFEYAMATQMDGRPAADIVAWAAATYGMELNEDSVAEFSRQLADLGFLEAVIQPPADVAPEPVSRLFSEAVSQVTALPRAKGPGVAAGAYGDFSFRGGESGGEETTADAEWSAQNSASTVSSPPFEELAGDLMRRTGAAAGREGDQRESVRRAPESDNRFPPPSSDAAAEFGDSEQTAHWVPPFGTDHPKSPSHWAADLNDNLQNPAPPPVVRRVETPPAAETLHGFGAASLGLPLPGEPPGRSGSRAVRPPSSVPPLPSLGGGFTPPPSPPPSPSPLQSRAPVPIEMMPTPPPVAAMPEPPPLVFERRQPPAPEQVVMAPFQPAPSDAGPSKQFRAPLEPPPAGKGARVAVVIMLLLAAVAAVGYFLWTSGMVGGTARQVRVLSPKPSAIYRWFDSTGRVAGGEPRTLAFEGGGRITDVLPSGSTFAAGEIIARLAGAALIETEVTRHRSRLLFYEQLRDSMRAAGDLPETRQAEIKIGLKAELLTEAEGLLAPRVIRAAEAGEVLEVLAKVGELAQPHIAAVKINPGRLRGEFTLAGADFETAAKLGFCRVEVIGQAPTASMAVARRGGETSAADSGPPSTGASARFVDCQPPSEAPADAAAAAIVGALERKFVVTFPLGAGVAVGQPLRLARARFDGVFPVPRAAVVRSGDTDQVFVASAGGVAEARAVTLVETFGEEALVAQGVDIGDAIIADAAGLRDGARVLVDR
jgi:hypothetical protein